MDLGFSAEETAFRDEVREFVKTNLPPAIRERLEGGHHPTHDNIVEWTRILAAKGWGAPHWPVEWGGTGWSPIKLSIFQDEIQRGHAPESLAFGTSMVGPVIYTFGTQAQKERFLPRILDLRRLVVPGLFGARRRVRSRQPAHHGPSARAIPGC